MDRSARIGGHIVAVQSVIPAAQPVRPTISPAMLALETNAQRQAPVVQHLVADPRGDNGRRRPVLTVEDAEGELRYAEFIADLLADTAP